MENETEQTTEQTGDQPGAPAEADAAPSIVEQEVGEVADQVTDVALQITDWLNENVLNFASIWQLAAIGGTLFLAILFRRVFERLLEKLGGEKRWGRILGHILSVLRSISLPVVWAMGLAICMAVFRQLDLPVPLMRLVGSLLNAFIVIRLVSVFIPSNYWSRVFAWVAWGVAALNAVGVLDPVILWMQATGFTIGEVHITLWTIVKGLIVTALLVWGANAVAEAVQRRLEAQKEMPSAMRLLIGKVTRIALVVIACVIGLTAVGVDLTAFAVFSGAIGLGIGLGLQQTVANLFAGFSLLAERSVQPGDVIEVETTRGATYGVITKMTNRYVAVRTRDNTETIIPNEVIMGNPVTNWTMTERMVRRKIPIGVAYDTDLDLAIKLCIEAAEACPRVLDAPKPNCLLRGFGDNSVDLEIRCWIGDPENGIANADSAVMMNVWKAFQEHQIEIPFPQRDIHIRSGLPPAADTGS